jgi:hypothetical protein
MATVIQVISRALRLINVADAGQAIGANEAQDAREVLNAMLAEWTAADFGFSAVPFTALDASTGLPSADDDAIVGQLAMRIAPEYGREVPQAVAAGAMHALSQLHSRYSQPVA